MIDFAQRDALNRQLGKPGEEFVVRGRGAPSSAAASEVASYGLSCEEANSLAFC
jgi:hypothetical protein